MLNKLDRLQQFQDLRGTIRGSDSILIIGVDVAKGLRQNYELN